MSVLRLDKFMTRFHLKTYLFKLYIAFLKLPQLNDNHYKPLKSVKFRPMNYYFNQPDFFTRKFAKRKSRKTEALKQGCNAKVRVRTQLWRSVRFQSMDSGLVGMGGPEFGIAQNWATARQGIKADFSRVHKTNFT